jgi:hypothetical protein
MATMHPTRSLPTNARLGAYHVASLTASLGGTDTKRQPMVTIRTVRVAASGHESLTLPAQILRQSGGRRTDSE